MYIYRSASAFRRIARELGVPAVYANQSRTIERRRGRLTRNINIGCSRIELPEDTLNRDISRALRKQLSFTAFDASDVPHPPVFSTPEEAAEWPYGWLARRDGLSAGAGITVYGAGEVPLQAAQYDFIVGILRSTLECRIHVGKVGEEYTILATQQKMGVRDNPEVVRNYASGVRYSLQPIAVSDAGRMRANQLAIQAVQALGLDFGAVDLLLTSADMQKGWRNKFVVLEVNTAPGISSEPLYAVYRDYIRNFVE